MHTPPCAVAVHRTATHAPDFRVAHSTPPPPHRRSVAKRSSGGVRGAIRARVRRRCLPATVALFKTLRMAGRPLLDAHLRAKKIETTPDKLDKGIGYAIAATIYHLHSLNSVSYIISTVHALTNAGFSDVQASMRGAGIATLQPSTWLCRYHAIGTIGYSFLRCRSCAHPGLRSKLHAWRICGTFGTSGANSSSTSSIMYVL